MMDDSTILLDFFQQVAPLLGLTCVSGILVAVWLVYVINVRRKRTQAKKNSEASYESDTAAYSAVPPEFLHADLPDLDLLLEPLPAELEPPKPIRREAAAAPSRIVGGGGTRTVYLDGGIAVDAIEVLTILRDVADGDLIIQIGDKAYRGQDAVDNPEVKRRFASIMREMSGLAQSLSNAPAAPASRPPAPSQVEAEPYQNEAVVDEGPSLSDLLNPAQSTTRVPPPPAPDGTVPGMLPSFKLDDNPLPVKKGGGLLGRVPKPDSTPIPELNIADAIEAYLQHKLAYSEYANRSIHVFSAPGGGVQIEVDGHSYEAVSDIEDTAVRSFITQTIEEWQDRH